MVFVLKTVTDFHVFSAEFSEEFYVVVSGDAEGAIFRKLT